MSKLTIILLVILVVLVVALVVLYFVGKKAQRRQIAQKEQMDAVAADRQHAGHRPRKNCGCPSQACRSR